MWVKKTRHQTLAHYTSPNINRLVALKCCQLKTIVRPTTVPLSVHLCVQVQHVGRNAARRSSPSAAAKTCNQTLAAPPLDSRPCISRFALGPGFVSQSGDVSLLVLCMPGVCYICGQFVSAVAGPQSAGRTTFQKPTTTLHRGHRAECWVPRQLCDTADNGGQAWGRKPPPLIWTDLMLSSISHARQLTFAPRTPVCPSAAWLRGHVSGKGANVGYQLRWR